MLNSRMEKMNVSIKILNFTSRDCCLSYVLTEFHYSLLKHENYGPKPN